MSADPHAAVVLAAGGSARLGFPKQLLLRDGEPLVRRCMRLVAATKPARLLVVTGADADAIEATLGALSCERLRNPRWGQGIGSSLALAAAALERHEGATLVVLCDQPALEHAHLSGLLELAARGCAATRYGATIGAPAVVTRDVLAHARTLDGDRGLGAVLRALPRERLALLDAPQLAHDLDTPEDVASARRLGLVDAAARR